MTNREEFCALLYGTFYESISDSAIIRQQHEKIRTSGTREGAIKKGNGYRADRRKIPRI